MRESNPAPHQLILNNFVNEILYLSFDQEKQGKHLLKFSKKQKELLVKLQKELAHYVSARQNEHWQKGLEDYQGNIYQFYKEFRKQFIGTFKAELKKKFEIVDNPETPSPQSQELLYTIDQYSYHLECELRSLDLHSAVENLNLRTAETEEFWLIEQIIASIEKQMASLSEKLKEEYRQTIRSTKFQLTSGNKDLVERALPFYAHPNFPQSLRNFLLDEQALEFEAWYIKLSQEIDFKSSDKMVSACDELLKQGTALLTQRSSLNAISRDLIQKLLDRLAIDKENFAQNEIFVFFQECRKFTKHHKNSTIFEKIAALRVLIEQGMTLRDKNLSEDAYKYSTWSPQNLKFVENLLTDLWNRKEKLTKDFHLVTEKSEHPAVVAFEKEAVHLLPPAEIKLESDVSETQSRVESKRVDKQTKFKEKQDSVLKGLDLLKSLEQKFNEEKPAPTVEQAKSRMENHHRNLKQVHSTSNNLLLDLQAEFEQECEDLFANPELGQVEDDLVEVMSAIKRIESGEILRKIERLEAKANEITTAKSSASALAAEKFKGRIADSRKQLDALIKQGPEKLAALKKKKAELTQNVPVLLEKQKKLVDLIEEVNTRKTAFLKVSIDSRLKTNKACLEKFRESFQELKLSQESVVDNLIQTLRVHRLKTTLSSLLTSQPLHQIIAGLDTPEHFKPADLEKFNSIINNINEALSLLVIHASCENELIDVKKIEMLINELRKIGNALRKIEQWDELITIEQWDENKIRAHLEAKFSDLSKYINQLIALSEKEQEKLVKQAADLKETEPGTSIQNSSHNDENPKMTNFSKILTLYSPEEDTSERGLVVAGIASPIATSSLENLQECLDDLVAPLPEIETPKPLPNADQKSEKPEVHESVATEEKSWFSDAKLFALVEKASTNYLNQFLKGNQAEAKQRKSFINLERYLANDDKHMSISQLTAFLLGGRGKWKHYVSETEIEPLKVLIVKELIEHNKKAYTYSLEKYEEEEAKVKKSIDAAENTKKQAKASNDQKLEAQAKEQAATADTLKAALKEKYGPYTNEIHDQIDIRNFVRSNDYREIFKIILKNLIYNHFHLNDPATRKIYSNIVIFIDGLITALFEMVDSGHNKDDLEAQKKLLEVLDAFLKFNIHTAAGEQSLVEAITHEASIVEHNTKVAAANNKKIEDAGELEPLFFWGNGKIQSIPDVAKLDLEKLKKDFIPAVAINRQFKTQLMDDYRSFMQDTLTHSPEKKVPKAVTSSGSPSSTASSPPVEVHGPSPEFKDEAHNKKGKIASPTSSETSASSQEARSAKTPSPVPSDSSLSEERKVKKHSVSPLWIAANTSRKKDIRDVFGKTKITDTAKRMNPFAMFKVSEKVISKTEKVQRVEQELSFS